MILSREKVFLVVSPDTSERRKLVEILQSAGYETHQAVDGVSGYKAACEISPKLVLTCVEMPRMNGGELADKLATLPSPPGLVVLCYSENLNRYFRPSQIRGVIPSGSDASQILNVIAKALENKSQVASDSVRVLAAGPDRRVTAQMSEILTGILCETRQAVDAGELITHVVEFLPDVILMDVLMEGMPAHEIVRTLRQMPQAEEAPILLYSYYPMENLDGESIRQKVLSIDAHQVICLEEGATAYVGRFLPEMFLKTLAKYLRSGSRKTGGTS